MRSTALAAAAVICAALSTTGCIKSMLVKGQISSTRTGSGALDTIGDLDLVEGAARAGLVQFEGMLRLAPDNTDALFLLTKGWTSYAYGFCEDHMEEAHDKGDDAGEAHFKESANMAYERAVGYGLQLLAKHDEGFEAARKGETTMKAWLNEEFTDPEDAGDLFWTGYAWLARTSLNKDKPEIVADLWIGVALLQRAVQLDPSYNNYSGLTALAAYHARSASAELAESKKLFDDVLQKTGGKSLTVHFAYATRYYCAKQDPVMYEKLLTQVIETPDPDPNFRLLNAVAKKRAKRWNSEKRMFEMCSMDPPPKASAGPAAPPPAAPAKASPAAPATPAAAPAAPAAPPATPPAKAPAAPAALPPATKAPAASPAPAAPPTKAPATGPAPASKPPPAKNPYQ